MESYLTETRMRSGELAEPVCRSDAVSHLVQGREELDPLERVREAASDEVLLVAQKGAPTAYAMSFGIAEF